MRFATFALLCLCLMLGSGTVAAVPTADLPPNFQVELIAQGMTAPTAMAFAPDGRLFVTEQGGNVRIITADGTLLSSPFLTLNVNAVGERGLLGIAFDPDFATNNYLYLYYTTSTAPIHNRLSRFTANGNSVVAGSQVVLLELDNLSSATNHNGGALHFGPDGKLYVAVGENAFKPNSQVLTNLHGKMLRLNKNGTIPTDNPFYNSASGKNRAIWALGLRNPYTFAFQPGTGLMYINDVGANTWEEINEGAAGANYGWPDTEGMHNNPLYENPLLAYPHSGGTFFGCAITAGVFYNPTTVQFPPFYLGKYFFADYCQNWIRTYDPVTRTSTSFTTDTRPALVDLDVAPNGRLYYLSRGYGSNTGAVYDIFYSVGAQPPTITQHPQSQTVAVGENVTFTCGAQGGEPLSFLWQRNMVTVNARQSSYTVANVTMADNGAKFRCIVSNNDGSVNSNEATLTVINGKRPNAVITTPILGSTFQAGDTISFAGTATDVEDGTLPASAFTWEIIMHHDAHTHPALSPTNGVTSGTYQLSTETHDDTNIWYRIHLRVRDSSGLTRSTYRDVRPRVTTVTMRTIPAGLQVRVNGVPYNNTVVIPEIINTSWLIEAPTPQIIGDMNYVFDSWLHGGLSSQTVSIPSTPTIYTAKFFGCPILDPSAPLEAPQRNYFTTRTPTLTWGRVSWAAGYWVQIDNQADFSDPEYSNNTIDRLSQSVTVGDDLRDCLYYWRVRAKTASGNWGPWSTRDTFVVDAP
ncbi:MAG: PQQ-dependent sugar dehydrogenase [Anaerolineae bacterium]|nr:PQQ-dependent sugar dehydrogenase [Anaerolineae bacterium]